MKKILIIVALGLISFSCKQKNETYQETKTPSIITTNSELTRDNPEQAKDLMEKQCYLCHSPSASENEGRIAPPMIAVKSRYLMDYKTKEDFVKAITTFVENPSEDKAKMFGAVKKFGVMPKQVFPENTVAQIAGFMFDYQIEEPTWFKEHWESRGHDNWSQPGKKFVLEEKEKAYEDIGLEYALATKKILGQNLMGKIQKKGTIEALAFCNSQAMPLTDSMSVKYNATIRRVSDKNRNPKNKANVVELKHIETFKNQIAKKEEPTAIVEELKDKVNFYYPITTNSMCLQCHGKSDNIKAEVKEKILNLYPNDLAIGYSENEIRGIWSITFDKKQ